MRKILPGALAALLCQAQGVITTVGGTQPYVPPVTATPAIDVGFGGSSQIFLATDAVGNLLVSGPLLCQVIRVTPAGIADTVAGNGICGKAGNGWPATSAAMQTVAAAPDAEGSLIIVDNQGGVRRVGPDGIIGSIGGLGFSPQEVAIDKSGNVYAASPERIVRFSRASGVSDVVRRNAVPAECVGPAQFQWVRSMGVDGAGDVHIGVFNSFNVCKVSGGTARRLNSELRSQGGITFLPNGELVTANPFDGVIYGLSQAGTIRIIAGIDTKQGSSGDGGPARQATMCPLNIAAGPDGTIFFVDQCGGRIRKMSPAGIVSAFMGTTERSLEGDGGPAVSANLGRPVKVVSDGKGNLFVATQDRIRRITSSGVITTVVGNGEVRAAGAPENLDGQLATAVPLNITDIAVTPQGELLVMVFRSLLARLDADGRLRTMAGDGFGPSRGDGGPAKAARIFQVVKIAVAPDGSIYLAEGANNVVRKIDPAGRIDRFAGTGAAGAGGEGGAARSAQLSFPSALAVDRAGAVYIGETDRSNPSRSRILVVGADGMLRVRHRMPEGQSVFGLAVDSALNLYVARGTNTVARLTPSGEFSTFAGGGNPGSTGDGLQAARARIILATEVSVDSDGSLIVVDPEQGRLRRVLSSKPPFQVSSTSLEFRAASRGQPSKPQTLGVSSPVPGLEFHITRSPGAEWITLTVTEGQMPRRITVSVNPSSLAPGDHAGELIVSVPEASPNSIRIRVTASIGPEAPPKIGVAPRSVSFTVPRSRPVRTMSVALSNEGGGTIDYRASIEYPQGGSWLAVSPEQGQVNAGTPVLVTLTASPQVLPGTYQAALRIDSSAGNERVPVILTVSRLETAIQLSQTGVSFVAVAGGGKLPGQSFGVINLGTGRMPWQASGSTLTGGDWLRVGNALGVTNAASDNVPEVTIQIEHRGLAVGRYFGQVRIDAPEAANTPQVVTVALDVVNPEDSPGSIIQPAELVFGRGSQDWDNRILPPGSKSAFVFNPGVSPVTFVTQRTLEFVVEQLDLLVTAPLTATVDPNQPVRLTVQPVFPGVRKGSVNFQFSDGSVRSMDVQLSGGAPVPFQRAADGCTATKLLPALLSVGQGFMVPAGAPGAVVADVQDDCGNAFSEGGAAILQFSNGDPPVAMQALKDGRWHGTWQTRNASGAVVVRLDVDDAVRKIRGATEANTDLRTSAEPPAVTEEGVVNAAQPVSFMPVAPGAMISVFGERLASSTGSAGSVPLPTRLGEADVVMGGKRLPLIYSSANQINAVVPGDLEPNTRHQLLVRRGNLYARPVQVNVAPSQPGVFTVDGRYAIAQVVRGTRQFLASRADPVSAGDVVILYCSGLGATQPPVAAGEATPLSGLSTVVAGTSVRIGETEVPVAFAGLTPGFVNLYQINLAIPGGIAAGDRELWVETAGQRSPVSLITVR